MDVASRSALSWLSHLADDLDSRVAVRLQDDLLVNGRSPWPAHALAARTLALRLQNEPRALARAHTLAGRADIAGLVCSALGWAPRLQFVVEKVLPPDYPALRFTLEALTETSASVTITARDPSSTVDSHPVALLVAGLLGVVCGGFANQLEDGSDRVRVVLEKQGPSSPRRPSQTALDKAFEEVTDDVALWGDELRVGQRLFGNLVVGRLTDEHPADAARSLQAALDMPGVGPAAVVVGSGEYAIASDPATPLSVLAVEHALQHGKRHVGSIALGASGVSDFVWACAPAIAADLWRHTRYRAQRLAGEHRWTEREERLAALVGAGQSNKEIGNVLGRTDSHVGNLLTPLRRALGGIERDDLGPIWQGRSTPPRPPRPAPSGILQRLAVPGAVRPTRDPQTLRRATPGMLAQAFTLRFEAWEERCAEVQRMRLLADSAAASLDAASGMRPGPVAGETVEEEDVEPGGSKRRGRSE